MRYAIDLFCLIVRAVRGLHKDQILQGQLSHSQQLRQLFKALEVRPEASDQLGQKEAVGSGVLSAENEREK